MNFTKQFMQENCGCYDLQQLNACSFMATESITLESIIDSEIPLKDKFWFCCKKVFTKEQNRQIAILCAESVLHIYEDKYPNDDRPRKAIQAAKYYLNGNISIDDLIDARRDANYAAAAAVDAAVAAAANAADAAAAYAADAAAAYANYAADAAVDAAVAAAANAAVAAAANAAVAAYAAVAALQQTLLNILKDFIKTNKI